MWFVSLSKVDICWPISEMGGAGWRELKLPSLPVAAALEEIRAAFLDSLLRTGARLGYHRLAGGLSKWRLLRKASLDSETFGNSQLSCMDKPRSIVLGSPMGCGHSKTAVSWCLCLCIAASKGRDATFCVGFKCLESVHQNLWRSFD